MYFEHLGRLIKFARTYNVHVAVNYKSECSQIKIEICKFYCHFILEVFIDQQI